MSMIMGALDGPQASSSRVFCLSDSGQPITASQLSANARQAAAWMDGLVGPGGTVAALLTASHDCLAAVFGAFRSGLTLVSLPHPARGMGLAEYVEQISVMCAMTDVGALLADPAYLELLAGASVPVRGYNEFASCRTVRSTESPGRFVQFTSGSTGMPRGIALSLDAIEANISSMYGWLAPQQRSVICSWLPLSHDMGFIGFALYGLCSLSPPWSAAVDLVLMKPEDFLADPGAWLRACTDFGATSTAAPPFALRFASRVMKGPKARFDLSTLRSLVVGSEPVSAEGLRAFGDVALQHGLSANAICPGYGMAETALAIAIGSTDRPWSSRRLDRFALEQGGWNEREGGEIELVSCGPPLPGIEVRTAAGADVGELELKSASLLSHYVGQVQSPVMADGWLHTSDLAHVDEEVFVVGRTDDVFVISGRNIDARELDAVACAHPAIRPGNAAAVLDEVGRYVVVVEPNNPVGDAAALLEAAKEIRVSLMRRFGASPSAVIFIERGTLPKTPSGKVRRNHLQHQWREGQLAELVSG
jgi:acyl-CoA synthetase (AMP-forming)/AMP-acid ligase II